MSPRDSWLQSLLKSISRRSSFPRESPPSGPPSFDPESLEQVTAIQPRVLMIIYNPIVDAATGRRLVETLGWNDPDRLAAGFIEDVQACSGGSVNYQIVQRIVADEIPVKLDGYQYKKLDYLSFTRAGGVFHNPDAVSYGAIIDQFNLLARIGNNEIDEVWLFGGPYFGFFESTMGGAGAFFCNAPPIPNTEQCPRRFVIMGFSYERGVGEMLEDLGHRAESILNQVYHDKNAHGNLFNRFAQYNQTAPGEANVGLMHFAPNSVRDYDWGNMTPVLCCCDDWKNFPRLPKPPNYRLVTAKEWGSGDIRLHHRWWFQHLPKAAGQTDGISNNWWKYVTQLDDPVFDPPR